MTGIADYKPVTLEDRKLFQDYFTLFPQRHSEYIFTGLLAWSHYTPAYYSTRDGCLLIMNMLGGKPQFRPPIGPRNSRLLEEVLDLARREGGEKALIAIDESAKEWINTEHQQLKIQKDRDFYDYVYLAKNLAELPGNNTSPRETI